MKIKSHISPQATAQVIAELINGFKEANLFWTLFSRMQRAKRKLASTWRLRKGYLAKNFEGISEDTGLFKKILKTISDLPYLERV